MNFLEHIQAQSDNENFAVMGKERDWTYKEFSNHVLFVCNYLTENRISKIMVCLPQGFYAYTILWGAYLSGVTFCPVTNSVPLERKKYYSSLFKPDLIIEDQTETFLDYTFISVSDFFNTTVCNSNFSAKKVDIETIAYVIFTSGSTGLPKGVMVSRKALENFLSWSTSEYDVKSGDRWGQFSNLGFDLSICDVFTAILRGATLIPVSGTADKLLPGKIIKNKKITFWHSVPSVVDLLNKAGHLTQEILSSMRVMTFCGERLFPAQLELLFKANPNLTIYNTYGPTEGTIFCSFLKLTIESYKQFCHNTMSIGKSLPGYKIVLSDNIENFGEIIITGDYIANGYLSTEDSLLPANNAFKVLDDKGKRQSAYFTGDYGEMVNENLYFICRRDSQIKVMGYRIDLNEIDYHLREYGCKANITIYYQNKIIAFLMYEPYLETEIKTYLAKKLPNYYLPNLMIHKQSFPYNSNGKIDVNELLKEVNFKISK